MMNVEQGSYRVIHRDCLDVWCVPVYASDKDLCGKILEANASSEYRTIAPFYFEQYLKRRYSTDADGMKCFDLLRNSIVYDFGRVAKEAGFEGIWRQCFYSGANGSLVLKNSIMSDYAATIGTRRSNLNLILQNHMQYKDL